MRALMIAIVGLAMVAVSTMASEWEWGLRIHKGDVAEEHALADIDSLTFFELHHPGACCFEDGSCLTKTADDCEGDWLGVGTTCKPNPCPPPMRVCCLPGDYCVLMAEEHCLASNGTWHFHLTSCDPNPCPVHQCPEMVAVPAGGFTMGDGVAYCGTDRREVTLTRSFYLGRTAVTNQQYLEAVQWAHDSGHVTATTSEVLDNLDGSTQRLLNLGSEYSEIQFDGAGSFYLRESPSSWAQSAYPVGYDPADHPVKVVTWYGAARYCDWLSLQAGLPRAYAHSGDWSSNEGDPYGAQGYRLPTDVEWEYAARWNDGQIYPWGNESPDCSRANYRPSNYCVGWTTPVGSYPDAPAALGLSDMAGNVWELCNDWWVCNLGTSPVTDPTGPASGTSRVLRGGSWGNGNSVLRCAYRYGDDPDLSHGNVGFRAARTLDP